MDGKYKNLPWALAKELSQAESRPSWESKNEGIHERINFDDTIWGFNLAGGAYYDTPLRVTRVKENSRAEKAGIKVGDVLRFINDVDTSLLTVQQAHDIILQSGIEIKLKLSAPDVEEPYHYTYEDQILEELREMKRKRDEESKQKRKPFTGAKTNSEWSCAWPSSKKRDVMYRESNCFLVPSKHEEKMRLKREKKKLEEDRAAEEMHNEKIISMMKTQNAYNVMNSDEEIESQYLELLHKNREKVNNLGDDLSTEPEYEIKAEPSESDKNSETKIYEGQELRILNTADDIENCIEEEKLLEKEDCGHSESNEQFINNDNITPAEHNGEMKNSYVDDKDIPDENEKNISNDSLDNLGDLSQKEFQNEESESDNENQNNITPAENIGEIKNGYVDDKDIPDENEKNISNDSLDNFLNGDLSQTEFQNEGSESENENQNNITPAENNGEIKNSYVDDKDIPDENEKNISNDSLDNFLFIDGDLSKKEFQNEESESENENQNNPQEIELQNGIILNGEDESQLSDEKSSIPSDDDDIFYEELVILDESETNSLTEENNEELIVLDLNKRDRKYEESNETQ